MASQALLIVVLFACAVGCFCMNNGYSRGPCWPVSIDDPRVHTSMKEAARYNRVPLVFKTSACVYGPYGPFNRYTDYYVRFSVSWEENCENVVVWDAIINDIVKINGPGCTFG